MPDQPPLLALVRDLMFASKITATARAGDIAVEMIRDPAKLGSRAGRKLLVDLGLPGAIEAASSWRAATGEAVVGFVGHTDGETIARARAAGIDKVMARSAFFEQLLDILQ